jgi:serine/threonine-protein kinase
MLWLADCYENTGLTASAWAMFREAAAIAAHHQDIREKVARRRAAELELRLTRAIIVVSNPAMLPGLEVHLDGIHITAAEIGVPFPVDPGIHTVSATAPAHEAWSSNVEIPSRPESIALNVPVLRVKEDLAGGRAHSAPMEGVAASNQGAPLKTAGALMVASGVAAGAAGAFFGLRAKAMYDQSNEQGHCIADRCDATGTERRSGAFHLATASTIAFGFAAAGLVAGGLLWFASPKNPAQAKIAVVPMLGPGRAAMTLERPF